MNGASRILAPLLVLLTFTENAGQTFESGPIRDDTLFCPAGQETRLLEWVRLCRTLEEAMLLEGTFRGLLALSRLSREQRQPRLLVDALLASASFLRHSVSDSTGSGSRGRQERFLGLLLEVARICGRYPQDSVLVEKSEAALGGKGLVHGVTVTACREGYRMREEGRPLVALRVLRGAEVAMEGMRNTEGARAQLLNDQCNILRGLGELQAAQDRCERALQLISATNLPDPTSLALFRFNLGQVLKDSKDYEGAIQQWLLATEGQQRNDVDTWISLGLATERLGRPAEGLQYLRQGWEADVTHPFPYIAAASLLFRAGLLPAATPLLQAVKQREGNGVGRHYHDRLAVSPPPNFQFPDPPILSSSPTVAPLPPLAARTTGAAPPLSDPPPTPPPPPALPGVVLYLTSDSEKELKDLAISLQLLHAHFLSQHQAYPVVIFHDKLLPLHIEALRAVSPVPLSFHLVDIESIPHTTPAAIRSKTLTKYLGYGLGYRGMCRFFSGSLFSHPALAPFQLYMRLDTDSFFLAPLPYDPFQHLHSQGGAYGFMATGREESKFSVGLWDTFVAAAAAAGLDRPGFTGFVDDRGVWDDSFLYTNFEVSRLDVWRSATYDAILARLDESGGFWLHRWGDGPVRAMAISFLLNASQVVRMPELPYWHQTLVQNPPLSS